MSSEKACAFVDVTVEVLKARPSLNLMVGVLDTILTFSGKGHLHLVDRARARKLATWVLLQRLACMESSPLYHLWESVTKEILDVNAPDAQPYGDLLPAVEDVAGWLLELDVVNPNMLETLSDLLHESKNYVLARDSFLPILDGLPKIPWDLLTPTRKSLARYSGSGSNNRRASTQDVDDNSADPQPKRAAAGSPTSSADATDVSRIEIRRTNADNVQVDSMEDESEDLVKV